MTTTTTTARSNASGEQAEEAQEKVLLALGTLPPDVVVRNTASDAQLCRAAKRRRGNILPQQFVAELEVVIEKRKRAPSVKHFANSTNTPFDDIARWVSTGAIASVGYRRSGEGDTWLLDPDKLPDAATIQNLYANEAHLPMSQRVFGDWTQATILSRGWTMGEIQTVLGDPDRTAPNPHHKTGNSPMRLYQKARVHAAEEAGLAPRRKIAKTP